MRVGLSLFHLLPGATGGAETYDRCLIDALVRTRPDVQLVLFGFRDALAALEHEPWASDVSLSPLPVPASPVTRVAAEQALALLARRHRVDVLHNLLTTAPAFPGVPQVTTIHDVIYKRYPETHFGVLNLGVAALVPIAVRRSRRIVTPSEATKDDLVRYFNADPARIDVTYEGPGLPAARDPIDEQALREKLGLGAGPFVLSVSARRPHKNLERLLDAFGRIQREPKPLLVLPGYATPHEEELRRRAPEGVRFVGWVDERTLDGLYRAAACLAFPSLAEGFGLPLLEAMARGTPVACSRTSSLPEVAGEAALYFDPHDTAGIAAAIERLLDDSELRAALRAAGLERAREFTWEATAKATVAAYERALAA